ncbi:hypothetical protein GCM10011488_59420 [Steroidobacter agaridevorans]|nr:hypothetical protein GCM10011488_59420 [Steroidobacter agaridevorans]
MAWSAREGDHGRAQSASKGICQLLQAMREVLQLFWPAAEEPAKRRLRLALATVASGAVLAATALAQRLAAGGTADIGSSRIEAVPPACAKRDGDASRGVAEHSNAPFFRLPPHLPDAP